MIVKAFRYCALSLLMLAAVANFSYADMLDDEDLPLTMDSRIKTYIYSPNEIFLIVLHHGFQSHIEFAAGETVDTISVGDAYAWEITPLNNMLFIKPLAKNIRTNMTIITNKRTYQFDIVSEELEKEDANNLAYVIRFYYPKKKQSRF